MTFPSPSQGALWLAKKGFVVFPLRPNEKIPAAEGWQSFQIPQAELTSFKKSNFGINLGLTGHCAIDIDAHKNGESTLAELEKRLGKLPPTLTQRTPRGGRHLIFQGLLPNGVDKLGPGVDTRGTGGYIVAAGSLVNDSTYTLLGTVTEPAELPSAWQSAFTASPAPVLDRVAIAEPDQDSHVQAVISYLDFAEPCVEGHGGDAQLFKVFCQCRDLGVTEDTAVELVAEYFNPRCVPEWSDEELIKKADNAYLYAQNSLGAKTPEAALAAAQDEFDVVVPSGPDLLPLVSAANTKGEAIPKRDWILTGFLLGSFLSLTGAPGGTGKSNFEILKAIAVVTGHSFLGDDYPVVKPGPVILYNCEDPLDEMIRRVEAFRLELGLSREDLAELYLVSGRDKSLNVAYENTDGLIMVNRKAIATLTATVKSVGAVMLSADPLVRTHWLNENDNMAMDKVTQAFQQVSSATGCAVSVVHHTNKGALTATDSSSQGGFRGAGSLVASARIGHLLTTMAEADAKKLGIRGEKRRFYFKVESAKANLTAPAEYADWYQSKGVDIANGERIGVCSRADLNRP